MEKKFSWRAFVIDTVEISESFEEFINLVGSAEWVNEIEGMTLDEIHNEYGYAIHEYWMVAED